MADQSITAPRENEPNPFAPPQSDLDERWGIGDSEALALRRVHLKEESYAKALTIANFFYVFVFGAFLISRGRILIAHLSGNTRAPWLLQPASVALQLATVALWVCALVAGWGFFRRKRWALWFQLAVAFCLISGTALDPLLRSEPPPLMAGIGQTAMFLFFVAPLFDCLRLRGSVIFDSTYAHAIEATPHIKAWPKLSLAVTLIEVIFVVVFVVSVILSMAS